MLYKLKDHKLNWPNVIQQYILNLLLLIKFKDIQQFSSSIKEKKLIIKDKEQNNT